MRFWAKMEQEKEVQPTPHYTLFTKNTVSAIYGMQPKAVQVILFQELFFASFYSFGKSFHLFKITCPH